MRRKLAVILFAALVAAPGASAYGWPVAPFDVEHPVRGNFGDPRTVFRHGVLDDQGLGGNGAFSFHNGIDISAAPGTPVYPVESGVTKNVTQSYVVVRSAGGIFQYQHVAPILVENRRVIARRTVLGYVQGPAAHVHLTEIRGGRPVNPLTLGRLTPYRDTTKPRVAELVFRDPQGRRLAPRQVAGPVSVAAVAHDVPSLPVPGSWNGLPVTPALVSWSLTSLSGRRPVPETTVVDFRYGLPLNRDFWRVYARGTYQNKPRFGNVQYMSAPGRYEFVVAPALDTRRLADDVYALRVKVEDVRGNRGWATETFAVCNAEPGSCS
ncbi:MAG: M23 family metallopeptidase [Actinobacteria bacterium]|nr:M23 family metallopeptidase [Actinomycetota bacterium]